jgi:hypothetical protein
LRIFLNFFCSASNLELPDHREQINRLFDAAIKLSKAERAAFMEAHATDRNIHDRVTKLLAEFEDSARALSIAGFSDQRGVPSSIPTILPEVDRRPPGRQFSGYEVLAGRFRIVGFIAAGGKRGGLRG